MNEANVKVCTHFAGATFYGRHGEGLPDPMLHLGQLKNFDDVRVKAIMRDNPARDLDLDA